MCTWQRGLLASFGLSIALSAGANEDYQNLDALTLADPATGVLTAASGNGESYTAGTGVWTVTGTLAQVNAALAAVEAPSRPARRGVFIVGRRAM